MHFFYYLKNIYDAVGKVNGYLADGIETLAV